MEGARHIEDIYFWDGGGQTERATIKISSECGKEIPVSEAVSSLTQNRIISYGSTL